jgi:ankyrin repeat protein
MNQTPLMAAAAAGNVTLVEALLERGAAMRLAARPVGASRWIDWCTFEVLMVTANLSDPALQAGPNTGQTIEQFEADLKNNLYKIWNRMSSGTYFPPVRAVSIPKKSGA